MLRDYLGCLLAALLLEQLFDVFSINPFGLEFTICVSSGINWIAQNSESSITIQMSPCDISYMTIYARPYREFHIVVSEICNNSACGFFYISVYDGLTGGEANG